MWKFKYILRDFKKFEYYFEISKIKKLSYLEKNVLYKFIFLSFLKNFDFFFNFYLEKKNNLKMRNLNHNLNLSYFYNSYVIPLDILKNYFYHPISSCQLNLLLFLVFKLHYD